MTITLQVFVPAFLFRILSPIVLSSAELSVTGIMKAELTAATEALKKALHSAIDDPNFNRSHLSELWRHYNGLQTITEQCAEDVPQIEFPSSPIYLNDNYDFQNIDTGIAGAAGADTITFSGDTFAAQPVDLGGVIGGQDVITFS
tara:strand:+ start:4225 stop:4659 length:435 start_codon:yes stop_codon:yes gene_type:complete